MVVGGKRRLYDALCEDETLSDKLEKDFKGYREKVLVERAKYPEIFSKGIPDSIFGTSFMRFIQHLSEKYDILFEDMLVARKFYSIGWHHGVEEARLASEEL